MPQSPIFDPLQTPPRVRLANFYPFAPGEVVGPQWSESNLFLPVTHGCGEIRVGPLRFQMHQGQILHVPWAAPIRYEADRRDPFVLIGVHLQYLPWSATASVSLPHSRRTAKMNRAVMQASPGPQPFALPFELSPGPNSALLDVGAELAHAFEARPSVAREALLRALALRFLVEFCGACEGSEVPVRHPRAQLVREMISWLELSYRRPIRRAELAERAGISESSLAAAFRAMTGKAPIDYLIDLRLDHAKRMLATGRERVGELAARVGIPDLFHFSKLFKRRVGCSPLEYRRRRRM